MRKRRPKVKLSLRLRHMRNPVKTLNTTAVNTTAANTTAVNTTTVNPLTVNTLPADTKPANMKARNITRREDSRKRNIMSGKDSRKSGGITPGSRKGTMLSSLRRKAITTGKPLRQSVKKGKQTGR